MLAAVLIFLCSCSWACAYKEYSGDYPDLYAVAINSVLWINGYSWTADFHCDPQIEKIDEDNYGRVIFSYRERYYKGSDSNICFSALIICQASNKDEVFYYEDVCYIVKEQVNYTPEPDKEFDAEEIDYLKSINDWDKELDLEKCLRREITKTKAEIPFEKELKERIANEFDTQKTAVYMDYLTNNSDDSKFIIYGYIWKSESDGICFVGLIEKENDSIAKLKTFVPSDVYDYQTEFLEFKQANGWE